MLAPLASGWRAFVAGCHPENTIMLESTMPALMRTKTGTLGKVSSPPYGPVHPRLNEIGGSALARTGEQGQHRRLQPFGQFWRTSSVGLALPCSMWDRCDAAQPLLSASSAWLLPNSARRVLRSDGQPSELPSLMRITYA